MYNANRDASQERPDEGQALVPAGNASVGLARRDQYHSVGIDVSEEGSDFGVFIRQYIPIII